MMKHEVKVISNRLHESDVKCKRDILKVSNITCFDAIHMT